MSRRHPLFLNPFALYRAIFAGFVFAAALGVQAQDYELIKPKEPKSSTGDVELPPPEKPPEEPDTSAVLVSKLTGVILIPDSKEVRQGGLQGIKGLHVQGIPFLEHPDFQKVIDPCLGKPVSRESINRMVSEIVLFYRAHDRPVVDVVVPEQDITEGVLQLVAMEGRVGEVRVEGNRWFSSELLTKEVGLRKGDGIRESALLADIQWLNANPFRQVDVVFTSGKERGETDLVLKTKDRFPLRVFTGYEDTGNDITGDERWLAGFNWGNAFGLDHQLNYQFTTSSDIEKLVAHSGSYLIPLPWHHRWMFFGSYATTRGDVPQPFNLNGRSWQASARYTIPLPTLGPYSHEFGTGFDFKQSNNNLEFGGNQVFATTTEIDQWVFDYNAGLRDAWGSTAFGGSLFYSPGAWTERNRDSFFVATRARARAEYMYGRFTLERVTRLPWDFTWTLKGAYQIANENLLSSEQLGVGGYNTVRGYEEREANGDEGYLASTEIRTPSVSLGKIIGIEKAIDQLQFLGFFDFGVAKNRYLLPGEDPNVQLAGAGPGIRYSINPYLSVRFDYGWQLYDTGLSTRYNSRGHLGIVIAY